MDVSLFFLHLPRHTGEAGRGKAAEAIPEDERS
jgi:hypothetical protein